MAEITVVGNVDLPDIPRGRAVTVERTPRIDGLLASRRIVEVDPDPDAVPTLIDDVQRWVGDDPDRAAVALKIEGNRPGGPRSTLVPWLEAVTDPQDRHMAASGELYAPAPDHTGGDDAERTGDPRASG